MAKVTWKGEPGGPDEITWHGLTFKKGEAVETDNYQLVSKAKTNAYFDVEGEVKAPVPDAPEMIVPPSKQPAQFPVPKPGEPKK